MTLPTIAGVQSRIHSLPNRPFFMLARDLADFYHVQVKRIMEQVRRNPGRFPEGFIFSCRPRQEKSPHFAETSQGKRHDLKQYGFTEKGALQLSSVLTGPVADAVSVTIIEAFLQLRDGTLDRLRVAAFKDEVAYIGRNRMRLAIKLAATEGWSFGKLWTSTTGRRRGWAARSRRCGSGAISAILPSSCRTMSGSAAGRNGR